MDEDFEVDVGLAARGRGQEDGLFVGVPPPVNPQMLRRLRQRLLLVQPAFRRVMLSSSPPLSRREKTHHHFHPWSLLRP